MNSIWTFSMDNYLKSHINILTCSKIGEQLGVSKNAVIGRYHRLFGSRFPYDAKRKALAEENKKRKLAMKQQLIGELSKKFKYSKDRDKCIRDLRKKGNSLQDIGDAIGLTRERVRQICL